MRRPSSKERGFPPNARPMYRLLCHGSLYQHRAGRCAPIPGGWVLQCRQLLDSRTSSTQRSRGSFVCSSAVIRPCGIATCQGAPASYCSLLSIHMQSTYAFLHRSVSQSQVQSRAMFGNLASQLNPFHMSVAPFNRLDLIAIPATALYSLAYGTQTVRQIRRVHAGKRGRKVRAVLQATD